MTMFDHIDFILASHSPRRRELLTQLGITYRIASAECEEAYPESLDKEEIPVYLSQLKSDVCQVVLNNNSLLITADTIVWADGRALGKPADRRQAESMLKMLSGKTHDVVTGITLRDSTHRKSFYCTTKVTVEHLDNQDINYYTDNYSPFDKAGSYGIQEWIGLVGVKGIEGCFFNVIGLPVPMLFQEIKAWRFA